MSNSTQASSTTAHYGLSQWAAEDLIRREDFNHDFAAIDAALHSQQQTSSAAITALEESVCLVRLAGTVTTAEAAQIPLDLSAIDLSEYAELWLLVDQLDASSHSGQRIRLTFNNSTSGYKDDGNSSYSSTAHADLGAFGRASGYIKHLRIRLFDTAAGVALDQTEDYTLASDSVDVSGSRLVLWKGGHLADVTSIQLKISANQFAAGAALRLYGLKK